jgi:Glutaredoxin-like domain (DUF836)
VTSGPSGAASVEPGARPRVVLVGKPDCHLCDEARAVVSAVCAGLGLAWDERSILDDPDLADQYWELIPVVVVDGTVLATWTVDGEALRAALT